MLSSVKMKGSEKGEFRTVAPQHGWQRQLRLKTNVFPWIAVVPNLGVEYAVADKWSFCLDVWYSPWKVNDKYFVKGAAILPEGRWWVKNNNSGSFLDIHLNIAWYNVGFNKYRYQDKGAPLLGAGIGYGYRIDFKNNWGMEFVIGAGVSRTKYDRFYNITNGALRDSRATTYWGIDRAAITLTYNLCDL